MHEGRGDILTGEQRYKIRKSKVIKAVSPDILMKIIITVTKPR